jgi:hypothetical protein
MSHSALGSGRLAMASSAYAAQLGSKRQARGKEGEIAPR